MSYNHDKNGMVNALNSIKINQKGGSSMKKIILLGLLVGIMTFPCMVCADTIFVTGSDLIGSRTTPDASGVVAADGWAAASGGFMLGWNISNVAGIWNYSYQIRNADGTVPTEPNLSHIILEVSSIINDDNLARYLWDFNVSPASGDPQGYTTGGSNPNMPAAGIYGIKFDNPDNVEPYLGYNISFKSTQAPIWGDFYAKDGKHDAVWATAWNTGFGTDPTSTTTSFVDWIPTPDTVQVPEPGILILLGLAMSAVGIASRYVRKI